MPYKEKSLFILEIIRSKYIQSVATMQEALKIQQEVYRIFTEQ
jgi:hypothetical protein